MERNESIVCPHCNHEHEEWWEYTDFEQDEHKFDMNCEGCGKLFKVEAFVVRTFVSDYIDED